MFIRGFRAKRILLYKRIMKAQGEFLPDNPDNEPDSSIELVREPDIPEVIVPSAQRSDCTDVFASTVIHLSGS